MLARAGRLPDFGKEIEIMAEKARNGHDPFPFPKIHKNFPLKETDCRVDFCIDLRTR